MKGKRLKILLAASFIGCSLAIGYAYNSYMNSFGTSYPTSPLVGNCNVCHNSNYSLNNYGGDFASNGHNLSAIENFDSDGDGYLNLAEINAGAFPGDPQSQPVDRSSPAVTLTMPATGTSLTVAISVSATDNVGVTGYMVNETATAPAANASGWASSAPANYTFSGAGNRTLYAWAKDAAGNVGGQSKSIVITLPDSIAPVVTSFNLPATASSLTVQILNLSATDNVGVTGYLVTESSSTPVSASAQWVAAPPTSYRFSTPGDKILYAWARDAAGNISDLKSANITIDSTVQDLSGMTVWKEKWFKLRIKNPDSRSLATGYLNIVSWDEEGHFLQSVLYTRDRAEQWEPTELNLHYASGDPTRFFGWFDFAGELAFLFRVTGDIDSRGNLQQAILSATGLAQMDSEDPMQSELDKSYGFWGSLVSLSRIPSGLANPEDDDDGEEDSDDAPRREPARRNGRFER